jgi:4-amino-4-deoxy-L-arabinose transferase-like glycosyltransferase
MKLATFASLVCLVVISILFLKPMVQGDGTTYLEAIKVIDSGKWSQDFVPNRILTTPFNLVLALFFIKLLGGNLNGWLLMNVIIYFFIAFVFFNLSKKIYKSEKVALITTLFLASNYAMVRFGLNFLMDIGGWLFYLLALLYVFIFLESGDLRKLFLATLSVSIGGLFKEYAFLGALPVIGAIFYFYWPRFRHSFYQAFIHGLIILLPTILLQIIVYYKFGYTYFDWLSTNQEQYSYPSRLKEYIKSLGSLLNLLGIIFGFGLWYLYKKWQDLDKNLKFFLITTGVSIMPIFLWPAITQRVLFVVLPFFILIAGFFIEKHEAKWYLFLPFLVLYILINFTMDSFILQAVNLPF